MEDEAEKSTTIRQICDCCEIEIASTPVVRDGKTYCCEGCAGGGPCTCDYADRKTNPSAAAGTATRGDVVNLLRDTLRLLENWQESPGETPTVDVADVLSLARQIREEAAAVPPPAAKPAATGTATLSVSGLAPGRSLQELIRRAREIAPGRPFSLEMPLEGTTVFHIDARALAPLCEAVASLDGYRLTSIWQEPEGASITLEEVETGSPAPVASAAPAKPARAAWEVGVDAFLNARHQVSGERDEAPHPHSWRLQARLTGGPGEDRGTSHGFETVRDIIDKHLAPYKDKLINRVAPFDTVPPTTENLASVLYDNIAADLNGPGLRLESLCVWDSPTSYVVYRGPAL